MKVDNPKFSRVPRQEIVACSDCPFAGADGYCEPGTPLHGLCNDWGRTHDFCCPTEETYTEACLVADLAQTSPEWRE